MYGCVLLPVAYGWTDSCLSLKASGIALDGGGCLLCFCVFLPAMSWAGFAGFVVGSAVGLGLGSGCLGRFSSCMGFALLSFFEVSVAVLDSVDARGRSWAMVFLRWLAVVFLMVKNFLLLCRRLPAFHFLLCFQCSGKDTGVKTSRSPSG